MKTILDTVFKCDCGCNSQLAVGNFGDGQFTFAVKENNKWCEMVLEAKDVRKLVELLQRS